MGYWHAKAIKRAGVSLHAVIDTNPKAAQRLAAGYRTAESFSDVNRMLDRMKLDVLHICTPLSTHYKFAELAVEAGLHVVIEKPITARSEEAKRLYDIARMKGVHLCPVHQFLYQEGVVRASRMLSVIGRIVHMEGVFCSSGGVGLEGKPLDEIVADILPHPLSLIQKFHPEGLSKKEWDVQWGIPGEFRAIGETEGIGMSILISMNSRPTECSFRVRGTNGTIHLDLFHGYMLLERGKVSKLRKIIRPLDLSIKRFFAATGNLSRRAIRREPAYPGLQALIGSFYSSLRRGMPLPISQGEALAVALVRDGLLQGKI